MTSIPEKLVEVTSYSSGSDALQRLLSHPMGRFGCQVTIVVLMLAVWEIGSGWFLPRVWVSSPSIIFAKLQLWTKNGILWGHLIATLIAASSGYVLGAVSGVGTGLAIGLSPKVERILSPFVIALYALPKVALAPLFVIFLGIGLESKIALVTVTVYFLLLYNTLDGLRDLDRGLADAYRVMGASEHEIALKVRLPGIMPWVLSGLRIAVRYAFTAAILGELVSGNSGIGFLIEASAGEFSSSGIFAGVLVLVIVSVTATQILSQAEKRILRWRV